MDDGLFVLQYTDDTNLFTKNNIEQAKNMKLLLCGFEAFLYIIENFRNVDRKEVKEVQKKFSVAGKERCFRL